jgi:hypothetical protein
MRVSSPKLLTHSFLGPFLVVFANLHVIIIPTPACDGAKILFAYPVALTSHGNVFIPIVDALAKRGHDVTLFTSIKPNRALPDNVRQITPTSLENIMFGSAHVNDTYGLLKNPWARLPQTINLPTQWCEKIMSDATYLTEFWNKPDQEFDVVITSAIGNECLYGLIWRRPTPLVLVSPTGLFPWIAAAMGNPSYAPAAPTVFLVAASNRMSFGERLGNFLSIWVYR